MSDSNKYEWDTEFVAPKHALPKGKATCQVVPLVASTLTLRDEQVIEGGGPDVTRRPSFVFLIKHRESDRIALFDLGIAQDWAKYYSGSFEELQKEFGIKVERDLVDLVAEAGVEKESVTDIVISHFHWDHTGEPSQFPRASVLVGPGEDKHIAALKDTTLSVRDLDWSTLPDSPVGTFEHSHDLFGDGSFLVVDAKGHTPGHVCALVRTDSSGAESSEVSEYVFLAADCCHHTRLLHESDTRFALWKAEDEGDNVPPQHSYHSHYRDAGVSLERIRAMDRLDNVFVVLAHDEKLWKSWGNQAISPELNGWKRKGLKPAK